MLLVKKKSVVGSPRLSMYLRWRRVAEALWLGGQRLRATFHRLAQLESHHVVGGERAKEQILLHE
jgi:hypothetical protein